MVCHGCGVIGDSTLRDRNTITAKSKKGTLKIKKDEFLVKKSGRITTSVEQVTINGDEEDKKASTAKRPAYKELLDMCGFGHLDI